MTLREKVKMYNEDVLRAIRRRNELQEELEMAEEELADAKLALDEAIAQLKESEEW